MRYYFLSIIIAFLSIVDSLAEDNPFAKVKIKDYGKIERVPADVPFFDDMNNKYFLEEFEGKTLLMVFWATWCAPCVKELPELDILKKDFKKLPIEIIAISEDYQGVQLVKEFFKDNNIRYLAIFHDYGNALFRDMNINSLPTTYIVDPEGIIKLKIEGGIDWGNEKVRQMILEHIPGNQVMPRNSIRDNSLNQTIKTPKLHEEEGPQISSSGKKDFIGDVNNTIENIKEKNIKDDENETGYKK